MTGRSRAGFTLVEAMIVLAVMAVMAGIAVPSLLGSLPGMRASGAARQVLSDLRFARTRAIERGVNVGVIFYPATQRYCVFRDDGSTNGAFDADDTKEKEDVRLTTDFPGIGFGTSTPGVVPAVDLGGAGQDTVIFRTNGSASISGAVYVMPQADAGGRTDRNRRVTVTAPTGMIGVQRYEGVWQ